MKKIFIFALFIAIMMSALIAQNTTYSGSFRKTTGVSELTDGYYLITAIVNPGQPNEEVRIMNPATFSTTTENDTAGYQISLDTNGNISNPPTNAVMYLERTSTSIFYFAIYNGDKSVRLKSIADDTHNVIFTSSDDTSDNAIWHIGWNGTRYQVQSLPVTTAGRRLMYDNRDDGTASFGNYSAGIDSNNYIHINFFKPEPDPSEIFDGVFVKLPTTTITPGKYMIVVENTNNSHSPGPQAMSNINSNNWFLPSYVGDILSNNIIQDPLKNTIWEIIADGDFFNIRSEDDSKYLSFNGTSPSNIVTVDEVETETDRQRWAITWDGANIVFTNQGANDPPTRILAFNPNVASTGVAQNHGFRNYTRNTADIVLPTLYRYEILPPQIISSTILTTPPPPNTVTNITTTIKFSNLNELEVNLHYIQNGTAQTPIPMIHVQNGEYTAYLPQFANGTAVTYWIKASYEGETDESTPQSFLVGTVDISTVRARLNSELVYANYLVRVKGIANIDDRIMYSTQNQFYIQDSNAGIFVYRNQDVINLPTNNIEGLELEVVGTLSTLLIANNQTQINLMSVVTLNDTPAPIQPISVTASELNADPEQYAGMLVKLTDVNKESGNWPPSSSSNIKIQDDTDSIDLRIYQSSDAIGAVNEPYWPVDITGILGFYNSANQIVLRGIKDIDELEAEAGYFTRIKYLKTFEEGYYVIGNSNSSNTNTHIMGSNIMDSNNANIANNKASKATSDFTPNSDGDIAPGFAYVYEFELHSDDIYYSIKSVDKGLYLSSTGTGTNSLTLTETIGDDELWTVNVDSGNFVLENKGRNASALRFNSTNNPPIFSTYLLSQDDTFHYLTLFKGNAITIPEKPEIVSVTGFAEMPVAGAVNPVRASIIYPDTAAPVVTLYYKVNDDQEASLPMPPTGNTNEYGADLPTQQNGARISYYVVASDANGISINIDTSETYHYFVGYISIEAARENYSTNQYQEYISKVRGVALVNSKTSFAGNTGFFIQNENAGIFVYTGDRDITIETGKVYEVLTNIEIYNGQMQISAQASQLIKETNANIPINPTQLALDQINQPQYNGMLVMINNISIDTDSWNNIITTGVEIEENFKLYQAYETGSVVIPEPYWPTNITGILSFYSNNGSNENRLFIRSSNDFVETLQISVTKLDFGEVRIGLPSTEHTFEIKSLVEVDVLIGIEDSNDTYTIYVNDVSPHDISVPISLQANIPIEVKVIFKPNEDRLQDEAILYIREYE